MWRGRRQGTWSSTGKRRETSRSRTSASSGYVGRGLGAHLLAEGVARAWAMDGTRRVWVHTCSLDGPAALANYEARGFVVFKKVTEDQVIPSAPLGPWPGHDRE